MVAAMIAAQPKEIPMTKAKAKRKPASSANDSKTKAACKAGQIKLVAMPAAHQRPPSASQPTTRHQSKKAHIIAMLRAPGGAKQPPDLTARRLLNNMWLPPSGASSGEVSGLRKKRSRSNSAPPIQLAARPILSLGLRKNRRVQILRHRFSWPPDPFSLLRPSISAGTRHSRRRRPYH